MTNKARARLGAAGLVLASVALTGATPSAARAEDGGYTAPPKGFQVTWKREVAQGGKVTGETLVHSVISAAGDEVVYKVDEPGGDEVRLLRGIFSYAYWRPGSGWAEYKFDKAAIRGLWPLAAGKEAVVKMDYGYGLAKTEAEARTKWARTETGSIRYKVLRRERVTTSAGTFDTFVIQRDRRFTKLTDKSVEGHRRIGWFAPSLGYVVKQVVEYQPGNPKGRRTTLELVSIKRPGK